MIGILYALFSAILKGVQTIYNKKNAVDSGVYVTSFSVRFIPIIIVGPMLIIKLYFSGMPEIGGRFYLALVISGVINIIATLVKIKAYEISDVSLIAPITSISPGLTAIAAFFIVNESTTLLGSIGLILIMVGVYVMNLKKEMTLLEPFISIFKHRGVQLIFLVLLLYSVSASYDKIGVLASSPILWVLAIHIFISLALFPIMKKVETNWRKKFLDNKKNLIIMGLLSGGSIIFQMMSLELILVSYTISIKRMSVLISVFLSWVILGEKNNIKKRALASFIILLGGAIITLSI